MALNGALIAQTASRIWPTATEGLAPKSTWSPDVDGFERRGSFIARIDLPGTPLAEIHVEATADEIVVFGSRPGEAHERGDNWEYAERAHGWFLRVIEMPACAWPAKAAAIFSDGVLEITVPLSAPETLPASGPEKITIPVRRA